VHGHKDQIEEMANEIQSESEEYKTGGRQVMCLLDTESMEAANKFFDDHRTHIKDPKGWIFISHRGVARGLDLNGTEAATMIINFRFSNVTEMFQTIGRGNRDPLRNQAIVSYVFVDRDVNRDLE